MLADTILAFPDTQLARAYQSPRQRAEWNMFADRLRTAPRFVMQRDAVQMILGITETSPRRLLSALSVCRLPFPRMWVEFAYADREAWAKSQADRIVVVHNDAAPPPQRLGFYLEQLDPSGRHILVQQAWVHDDDAASIGQLALVVNFDPDDKVDPAKLSEVRPLYREPTGEGGWSDRWSDDPDESAAMAEFHERIRTDIPPWTRGTWALVMQAGQVDAAIEMAKFDLRSEWRFVLSVLATLNSRNVISYGDVTDMTRLNKARRKNGKPELLDYRDIRLSLSRVQRMRSGLGGPSGRDPVQAHTVMGHWKLRKSGLFWWSFHTRGTGKVSGARTRVMTA